VWSKLIINSAVNPLAALFDVPNGELLTDSHLREVLHGVTRESVAVARALNYAFSDPEMIAKVDEVCRRTAENISSMLQDVRQGKTTEIEFINGAIVHAAQQSRIPAPLNRLLLKLIRRISA
jgi:2-dehydropantoate 2-reductase